MALVQELDFHRMLQDRIRVLLISTPRGNLTTCRVDEAISEAIEKSIPDDYDFLPVVSGEEIVGSFETKRDYAEASMVAEVYNPLKTEMLIGGDASVIDFVESAHQVPFRFVVSKNGIIGIVTLSDLQQFPTRASLFTLIMDFEMLLAQAIEVASGQHLEEWSEHLSQKDKKKTKEYVDWAKKQGRYVNDLLVTSLDAKVQIVGALFPSVRETLDRLRQPLKGLRDRLAHGDVLESSLDGLKQISLTVRDILQCRRQLEALMGER